MRQLSLLAYFGVITILCYGCLESHSATDKPPNYITHYNVIIAPDLSNRLVKYPKPVSDNAIVKTFLDGFYSNVITHRRQMQQKDKLSLDMINREHWVTYNVKGDELSIDLSRFKNQLDRIQYLGPLDPGSPYNKDLLRIENELTRIANTAKTDSYGSDIWTYLNEDISDNKVETSVTMTNFSNEQYINTYKNVLILLTDGYLESRNCNGTSHMNKCLSQSMVNQFRNDFNEHGRGKSMANFFKENGYGIVPVSNHNLKYFDVLVLEVNDRTITPGGATKTPTDLEIMKLFWTEWLHASGVKKCDFIKTASTKGEANMNILKFIGVSGN
jgi:hypothetical protein